MRSASRVIGMMVVCVVLVGAGLVLAADWPQWRGENRDGKAAGFTAPATWPKELAKKWSVKVGSGDATPALVGDKLYVFAREGDDEVTLCLNAADGKEVWRDKFAVAAIGGPAARAHAGPRSSPAVADGKVVTLGVNGVLSCLNAADGKPVWRKEDIKGAPKFFTASSPLIADGMVIAQLGGEADGAIYAFSLADGTQKWKCPAGTAYASPVLLTADGVKQVVTLTNKDVVGVAVADGKLLWQVPFAVSGMAYNAATPVVDGQTVIVSGKGRGTKALKIAKEGDAFAAKELWASPTGTTFSSPVLKDGVLYAVSDKGSLFALNAKDGKDAWTAADKLGDYGCMVEAGSAILVLANKGQLVAFKPGDKEFAGLANYKLAESTYANPVLSGKNIYVKDDTSLTLWTVE